MKAHVCGQGCNGDVHAELIAEPPDGFHPETLKRWIGAEDLVIYSLSAFQPIFFAGSQRNFAVVLWR